MFVKRIVLGLLLATGGIAHGGEPAQSLQPILPYVNDMTFMVIRIDVARVKPDDVIRHIDRIFGAHAPADKKDLPGLHAKFTRAGGTEIFLVFTMGAAGPEALAIAAATANADRPALRELLKAGAPSVEEKDGMFLMGPEATVAAAMKREARALPELAKAFAAVASATAQVIVVPPRPFLRAQEELAPNLPKELGGGPIAVVTKGFQWAAIGIDVTPKLNIRATVQAADADAAEKLQALSTRVVNGLMVRTDGDASGLAPILPILKPRVVGAQLVLNLDDKAVDGMLTPSVRKVQAAAARGQSANNLKQIALALHNYHDAHGSFPPGASRDGNGKSLLSWRVHILPYIEHAALYREFKLDEPWDSEHNKKLIAKMPKTYQSPLAGKLPVGKTVYLAPAGMGMIFGDDKGLKIAQIVDGTSNTILVVEANDAAAVIWTKPDDYQPNKNNPLTPLARKDAKGFQAAFADGSVRMLSNTIAPDVLWALLTAAGGEVIPNP